MTNHLVREKSTKYFLFLIALLLSISINLYAQEKIYRDPSNSKHLKYSTLNGIELWHGNITAAQIIQKYGQAKIVKADSGRHSSFYICYISNFDQSGMIFRGITSGDDEDIYEVTLYRNYSDSETMKNSQSECTSIDNSISFVKLGNSISLNSTKNQILELLFDNNKKRASKVIFEGEGKYVSPDEKKRKVRDVYVYDALLYSTSLEITFDNMNPKMINLYIGSEGTVVLEKDLN